MDVEVRGQLAEVISDYYVALGIKLRFSGLAEIALITELSHQAR